MMDSTWNFSDVLTFLGWVITVGFCLGIGGVASVWISNLVLSFFE